MNNDKLTDSEKFIAEEQYRQYGRIIPCRRCKNFVADEGGYGYCGSRIVKEGDWCSRAKDSRPEIGLKRQAALDYGIDDHDVSGLLEE